MNNKAKSEKKCLHCYGVVDEEGQEMHSTCCRSIFKAWPPPVVPYTESEMADLAEKVIKSQVAVTGVQPKLSLNLTKASKRDDLPSRFTIVGLWGDYILKPPTEKYKHLPEMEHLTLRLAHETDLPTVPNSLVRLKSGALAFITRRIDRQGKKKLHMEDMCQLTGRLTEDKYRGSHEQVAKALLKYSANPGLDMISFYEQVIFSFLTGNADMHLKNFSMIKPMGMGYMLTPAYDHVPTALFVVGDTEEVALTLNGKKRKLNRDDFETAMRRVDLSEKVMTNIFSRFEKKIPAWDQLITNSFAPEKLKIDFQALIKERATRLSIG